ncbi:FAD-dependent oxidoreductase [Paenibacillus gansuensis]|uniref:FAD-dependent oxidoreductase n=1 Tax=Paenibacillus gansuensis TaxID=306542 RepID=A0ABW5PB00_9BACL
MLFTEKRDGSITSAAVHAHFSSHYDVIVVGLGTAGAIAAITAARKGLKVLGLERLTCMGGTGTVGGVVGYYYGNRGGIFEGIDAKVASYQEQDDFVPFEGVHAEIKNWILDKEAVTAGVEVHYNSFVTGVFLDGLKVKGIRWASPAGIHESSASIVIDATGNADVCELAGCQLAAGRELDQECQPFSNVQMKLYSNGSVGNFYTDSGYMRTGDPVSVNRAIFESNLLGTHLREKFTDDPLLLKTAPLLGIRESSRIVGEEQVTLSDVLADRLTQEPVFFGFSNLDNHGKDMAFESEIQQDWLVAASLFGPNLNVPIPKGVLIPQGYDGLLAAGRCISLDHDIASAVRQKRDMEKCGEVAASMAYLSVQQGVSLKDVPYGELRKMLLETNCLNPEQKMEIREITPQEDHKQIAVPEVSWLTETDEIRDALAGEKPGIAIWSVKRLGEQAAASLTEWLICQDQPLLRKNSAIALALLENRVCLPVLREMVYARDLYLPKTSRKYNQPHVFAAIYLLGRLKDQEIMPELLHFMNEDSFLYTQQTDNRNEEFIYDLKELYFQYFTFSMMAALRIADTYEHWRNPLMEAVSRRLADPGLDLTITLKSHFREANGFLKKRMNDRVQRIYENYVRKWDC